MKNYIKPTTKIVMVEINQLVAVSSVNDQEGYDDGVGGFSNEDFGWGDDEDPASWNWKNN